MQYEINHLHLELSSFCNARCPCCPRNFQGYPYNMGYTESNLSLKDFKRIFSLTRLSRVHIAIINGNFGDALMNPETPDIVAYMRRARHDMSIRVHTNGGARDRDFWTRLAKLNVIGIFAIDGLSDTHSLYRQDTVFENVIRNAKTFIDAGGNAIWMATVFDHNRHQLPEMHKMAKDLGFMWLEERDTGRNEGPVYGRQGQKVFFMQHDWQYPDQIDGDFIQTQIKRVQTELPKYIDQTPATIDCWAVKERSVYVSADGHVYPCCWTGHDPHHFRSHNAVQVWNQELSKYVRGNHGPTVGLESAIAWFDDLAATWESNNQAQVCKRWCTKNDNNNSASCS